MCVTRHGGAISIWLHTLCVAEKEGEGELLGAYPLRDEKLAHIHGRFDGILVDPYLLIVISVAAGHIGRVKV